MTASSYVSMELVQLTTVSLVKPGPGLKSLAMVNFFPIIVFRLALPSDGVPRTSIPRWDLHTLIAVSNSFCRTGLTLS